MAWVTTLGPAMQQIDYRLKSDAGCSLSADNDSQVQYRLESDRPLEWVGEGLREVGIEPGSVLDEAGIEAARALADGRDPRTGEVLVAPKMAVHPEAKLDAAPLVEAVRKAAADAGIPVAGLLSEPRQVARYGRLLRGVARAEGRAGGAGSSPETVAHRAPVRDLEAVAKAAGIDLAEVYDRDQLEHARRFADARVAVGNRGYDLTLDLPKSYSVLMAMAPPETAAALENTYLEAVRETVTAVQGWAGYAMRGHHGDGQRAERVDGTGLLGWMTVHRTARPVPGAAPDPHLHAHVTLLNLVRGVDGRWSTVGAGGRDIHRHAAAADAFMKARLRELTHQRWGIGWARNERTGAWEIAAVPERLREVFAKRSGRVAEQLQADGHDPEQATTAQAKQAAAKSREAKLTPGASVDLREDWHRQAAAVDVDPAALMAEAMPGPGRPAPEPMPVAEVAGHVFRAEQGLTGHRKVTTTADVLAAVMDAQPGGISDLQQAETLTDQVLAEPVAVSLPPAGAVHLSNASRYTSVDIVDAERTVLTAARDRFAAGYAAVDATQAADAIGLFELGNRMTFSPQQRAVLDRLLTGGHGLDTVIGAAGAGKTTLMSALRTAHALADHHVAGAATAAVAAQNLQREAQIPSRTVASWLWRIEHGEGLRGVDVLVVDEAAMVDDRDMARLLTAAGQSGTQVIAIGDPLQLKAPGVGGTFAAAHALVAGLELSENRRQVDTDERAALALWRDDQRRAALRAWNSSGRLHVTATPEQAREAIVAEWAQARTRWDDPHDRIAQLLLLAHRNVDVDDLNDRARQARVSAGELGTGHTWQLADGRTLTLAVGDQVLARTNNRDAGVLNGHRGLVVAVDAAGRVQIERRELGPDGPATVHAWVDAGYIRDGGLSLGYAMTAAKAQGLSGTRGLVYGTGMDAHVLYPAMSRDRQRADLWLALDPLETDADRARLGAPAGDAETRQRAVTAYAAQLERDLPDRLVLTELGERSEPVQARPVPSEPRPYRAPVSDIDALAVRVEQLPDQLLRQIPVEQELTETMQRRAADKAIQQQYQRELMTELRTITAGADPSGRYTRLELNHGVTIARDEQQRQQKQPQRPEQTPRQEQPQPQVEPQQQRPEVPHWRSRPYGTIPTSRLATEAAAAEKEAARLTALAARQRAEAEQIRARAEAGQGPAMTALHTRRDELTAQAAAVERAAALQSRADAARQQARQARAEADRLDQRNPLARLMKGTAQQAQLREQARAAEQAAQRIEQEIRQLYQGAGGRRADRAPSELAALTRTWRQRTADARSTDAAAWRLTQAPADSNDHNAGVHRQRAAGLRAEAELRDRLTPARNQQENQARAQRQAAARQAAEQRQRKASRQHTQDRGIGRRGPSRGR